MKISVVIPTSNRVTILETIKSIIGNTIMPEEIVIVDQGSLDIQDQIKDIIPLNVKFVYLKDTGSGAARARNLGWRRTEGDFIAFTDDDAIVSKQWLESILNSFNDSECIGIVSGKIIPDYKEKSKTWDILPQYEYILPSYNQGDQLEEYMKGAYPPSVNIALPKKILEEINGFNEKLGPNNKTKGFLWGEDCELAIKVKKINFKIIYNPAVMVYHPVPMSRQNIDFLKKRMFISGYTKAYLDNCEEHFSLTQKVYIIYNIVKKVSSLFRLRKTLSVQEFEAEKQKSMGYLSGIIRFH